MEWYNYVSVFFAGAFLANFVPHFVKGVCGDRFPTPFAKPPGKGLSSPLVNVVWAFLNLLIGVILLMCSKLTMHDYLALSIFFVGFALLSISMSNHFAKKDKE